MIKFFLEVEIEKEVAKVKKMVSVFGGLTIVILALIIFVMPQPNYFHTKVTWYGGLRGDDRKLEGKTLGEISAKANELAAIYGKPVQFKTEDGRMVYQAYVQGLNKSRCLDIHEKAWQGPKLIINEVNKVCDLLNYNSVGLSSYPEVIMEVYPHTFHG